MKRSGSLIPEDQSGPRVVKAILFDFDGTLIDASETIIQTFNSVMNRFGLDPWTHSRITTSIGKPLVTLFKEVRPDCQPSQLQQMLKAYEELAREEDPRAVRLKPNVRRTLTSLSENVQMGVVTSRRGRGARNILRRFELEEYFSAIIGIESVDRPKPDAEPLRLALELLGVPPEEALMVGDTPDDVRSARNAGVRSAGVATGHQALSELLAAEPDYIIHDLSELTQLPELAGTRSP